MKQIRFQLTIGLLFILVGLLLGYEPLMGYLRERQVLGAQMPAAPIESVPAPAPAPNRIEGKPVRIRLERLGIDVAVTDGHYSAQSKQWSLSNDKAHYALMTVPPNNQAGNTFIYGHNRKEVFSKLAKIQAGDKVVVYTDNGHTFTYVFQSVRETHPNDDSLFRYQGGPILTLQTCSGLWYQNRSLYTFALSEVK